jgi:hypothetical protein
MTTTLPQTGGFWLLHCQGRCIVNGSHELAGDFKEMSLETKLGPTGSFAKLVADMDTKFSPDAPVKVELAIQREQGRFLIYT